eukprot:528826_1
MTDPLLQRIDNLVEFINTITGNKQTDNRKQANIIMATAKNEEQKKFIPNKLLSDINKKNKKNKKKQSKHPKDIQLPATPKLPIANITLPWLDKPLTMKVLMFYHSRPHIFGCQFSNLFYSPYEVNTKWIVPTKDGTKQTLMRYEISNIDTDMKQDNNSAENIVEFRSSESIFQAAKAKRIIDALFVHALSPGDAARAGQGRLKMSNGLANKYKKFDGVPFKISNNNWQFSEKNKRYEIRQNWHTYKIEIMNYALRLKFKNYYNLIKEYVDSEMPIYFVEHTHNDNQWGDNYDGKGTNYLGKLLTVLCWEFRLIKDKLNEMNIDDVKSLDIKWTIDTMSDTFLRWLKMNNIALVEDGNQFYAQNKDCDWLK